MGPIDSHVAGAARVDSRGAKCATEKNEPTVGRSHTAVVTVCALRSCAGSSAACAPASQGLACSSSFKPASGAPFYRDRGYCIAGASPGVSDSGAQLEIRDEPGLVAVLAWRPGQA